MLTIYQTLLKILIPIIYIILRICQMSLVPDVGITYFQSKNDFSFLWYSRGTWLLHWCNYLLGKISGTVLTTVTRMSDKCTISHLKMTQIPNEYSEVMKTLPIPPNIVFLRKSSRDIHYWFLCILYIALQKYDLERMLQENS